MNIPWQNEYIISGKKIQIKRVFFVWQNEFFLLLNPDFLYVDAFPILYLSEYPCEYPIPDNLIGFWSENPRSREKLRKSGFKGLSEWAPESSGHTQIGNHTRSVRKYPLIVGLYMGVGSVHERYFPIKEMCHIDKFRCSLAMKIDHDSVMFPRKSRKESLDTLKWIIQTVMHENGWHEIYDQEFFPIFFDYLPSFPRYRIVGMFEIVGRANLDGFGIWKYLSCTFEIRESMIASREHIETEVFHEYDMFLDWSFASCDIFGIGDHEIGCVSGSQCLDIFLDHTTSGSPKDIAQYE